MTLLLYLIVVLLIVGVLLWAIRSMPWIDANIKQVIYILVVVVVAIWVIYTLFGAIGGLPRLPR